LIKYLAILLVLSLVSVSTVYAYDIKGTVTKVIDGDTIIVKPSGKSEIKVRITLIDTPEYGDESTLKGYSAAKSYTKSKCYSKQAYLYYDTPQKDIYGRTLALTYCDGSQSSGVGHNMNAELRAGGYAGILTQFCSTSKYGNTSWASPPC
jgi:micrococcal nuclease